MALKDLQVRLKTILSEIDGLMKKEKPTSEEDGKLTSLIEEGHGLRAQIERQAKADELVEWAGQRREMLALTGGQDAGATVDGLRRAGTAELVERRDSILVNQEGEALIDEATLKVLRNPEYKTAFRSYIRGGLVGLKAAELRVIQEGSDQAGGFLVPEDMLNRLIAREPAPTRLAGQVTALTTSRDSIAIPKVVYSADDIYTTGIRVTWTGEIPASATQHRVTEPVWGQARIPIYTAMMSMPLTNDQVEDSAFPILSWSEGKFRETIDLTKDNMIVNGSGIGQPMGLLVNPGGTDQPAVVNSGAAAALLWAGLQKVAWAIPEQYDDGCVWGFNKTSTGLAIASLLDSTNRPLWTEGVQDSGMVGSPKKRTLLGYPVVYSPFYPIVAANAHVATFGDHRGWYLVNRIAVSIQVLRELYAETNQILLLARVRFGGACLEPWRLRIHKVAV